jgi:hypothetical protein
VQPQQSSTLPVPFQQSPELIIMSPSTVRRSGALMPIQVSDSSALVEIEPDAPPTPIHVLPMYTKPRPIIPRYRAISGFLSVIIVSILLCTGAGYYAKASGKLSFLREVFGDARPQNIHTMLTTPLVPPPQSEYFQQGDGIINSASTASSIDPDTGIALQPENTFAPNQIIYLTYHVQPPKKGVVVLKWYTNNLLFRTFTTQTIDKQNNGVYQIAFAQPLNGKVELYWSEAGQPILAIRLYFVVKPR